MKRIDYEEIKNKYEENRVGSLACGICCITVMILIFSSLNVAGLIVGSVNQNATCYQDKYVMSLAQWLIIENSVAIVSSFLYLIFLVVMASGCNEMIFGIALVLIPTAFFFLVMLILGIIELAYQFPTCKSEIGSVCGMMILSIVLSLLYTGSTSRYTKK